MSIRPRPLSPHLQVYRLQMTSALSFLHRATGLFLVFGTLMVSFWVIALALGYSVFVSYQTWLGSLIGKVLLVFWSFSLFYHWANGIRHLLWDVGWGYDIGRVYMTGWIVVSVSVILTGLLWLSVVFV
jgi:succinate dehydrogenase / fumarate reductase cytochrome b subunit